MSPAPRAASPRHVRRHRPLVGPVGGRFGRLAAGMLAAHLSPAGQPRRGRRRGTAIHGEILIGRPVEEVFDFLADERNEPRYNPGLRHVELLTPGPIGQGARFRAETAGRGRSIPMFIEWTGYQRPHRLASVSTLPGMEISGELILDPVTGGTRLRWSWRLRPRGVLTLVGPLLALVGRRREAANWAALRRHLERGGPAGPGR